MNTIRRILDQRKQSKLANQVAAIAPTLVRPDSRLAYSCGHTVGVRQVTDQECPECRAQRRVNKRKSQAKKQKAMAPDDSGRLPDGTTINGSYDAARRLWNLQIITPDGVFDGEGSAIHKLMMEVGKRALEAASQQQTENHEQKEKRQVG